MNKKRVKHAVYENQRTIKAVDALKNNNKEQRKAIKEDKATKESILGFRLKRALNPEK